MCAYPLEKKYRGKKCFFFTYFVVTHISQLFDSKCDVNVYMLKTLKFVGGKKAKLPYNSYINDNNNGNNNNKSKTNTFQNKSEKSAAPDIPIH